MGYNLLKDGVYWCYYNPLANHLLTSWDIQVRKHVLFDDMMYSIGVPFRKLERIWIENLVNAVFNTQTLWIKLGIITFKKMKQWLIEILF